MDDSHPFRSMSIGRPIPEIKLFQTLTLKLPRSRSWVWSKGKVIQSAHNHINSLPFHFKSISPTIPEIQLFRNLTLKYPRSRSWVRSGQGHILYPTCNRCTSFLFHINRTNHCWDKGKIVLDLEKTHPKFLKKICQNTSFQQNYCKI